MVVSPMHQGQGFGTQLLSKLIQIAQKEGANTIMLNARITAVALYQKQGFKEIGKVYNSTSTNVLHIKMVYHANT